MHEPGAGKLITNGDKVTYAYLVRTLRGDTLYFDRRDGLRTIRVGSAEDTQGLDEAMLALRCGAQATVIIIPEKAYGYVGDHRRIPQGRRLVLRYDVKIVDVK